MTSETSPKVSTISLASLQVLKITLIFLEIYYIIVFRSNQQLKNDIRIEKVMWFYHYSSSTKLFINLIWGHILKKTLEFIVYH